MPIFLFLLTLAAQAGDWDLAAGAGGRTKPEGGGIGVMAGYGQMLWGQKESKQDLLYGYIRPNARATTSLLVNRLDLALDAFPISFAGVTVGAASSHRIADLGTFECEAQQCKGRLDRLFVRSKLIIGYKDFFGILVTRFERHSPSLRTHPFFADEWSTLFGTNGHDVLQSNEATLGISLPGDFKAGLQLEWMKMLRSRSRSDHESVYGRKTIGDWSFTLGAGTYRSTLIERGLTVYALLERTIWPTRIELGN
jgi:hypothetical protein